MVGAIVRLPTDEVSQGAVVGSVQRVVVARARASRDAVVRYCLENFGFEHPDFELEGSARSVVQFEAYFRKLHHALRMPRLTSMDR